MTISKTILSSTLAAAGVCAVIMSGSAPAEARGHHGAAVAAGFLGATALGVAAAHAYGPRPVYVSKRYSHRCGCLVSRVRYYY